MRTRLCILANLLWLALAGCRIQEPEAVAGRGTGSETTNHIAGIIREADGSPAARTLVALVPDGFDPLARTLPPDRIAMTDAAGRFRFDDPPKGRHNLEALGLSRGRRGRRGGIPYGGGGVVLDPLPVAVPGALRIQLPGHLAAAGGHVFIPGSTFQALIGEGAEVFLPSLPPMRIPELLYARHPREKRIVLAEDVEIRSGETAVIRVSGLLEAAFLVDGGSAGLAGDVADFPLLLRLDSTSFDFSLWPAPTGLAFARPGGKRLRYEVERWDARSRKAEIWVRMDTVRASADSQVILMRWGEPDPLSRSEGAAVFDSEGFAGVWHMGGSGFLRPEAGGRLPPAAFRYFEGDEDGEGMVGRADRLDAVDDHLDLGVVDVETEMTLSAWIRMDAGYPGWSTLLRKQCPPEYGKYGCWTLDYSQSTGSHWLGVTSGASAHNLSTQAGTIDGWILIHGTYDGRALTLYRNGIRISSEAPGLGPLNRGPFTVLAGAWLGEGRGEPFAGAMDEIRIERMARSGDWIRLCYETQRAESRVVRRIR